MEYHKQEVYDFLEEKGIEYEAVEHEPVFTVEEMMKLDLPNSEALSKNLLVRDDKKRNYFLIVVPEDKKVDLKEFSERIGSRKLSLASEKDLMKYTKLTPGSVSPFGILNDEDNVVQVFIDEYFKGNLLGSHPNDNSASIWYQSDDLYKIIEEHGNDVQYFKF